MKFTKIRVRASDTDMQKNLEEEIYLLHAKRSVEEVERVGKGGEGIRGVSRRGPQLKILARYSI